MMMHTAERHIARATWRAVEVAPERLLGYFNDRLYALDPSLRLLVLGRDPAAHDRSLLHAVAVAVANLERLDAVVTRLHPDEPRTVVPLAPEDDGGLVGKALLWAVEQVLGPAAWTPPVREAWQRCVALLAQSQRPPLIAQPARVPRSPAA